MSFIGASVYLVSLPLSFSQNGNENGFVLCVFVGLFLVTAEQKRLRNAFSIREEEGPESMNTLNDAFVVLNLSLLFLPE